MKTIDLRSDTVTRPSDAMRAAMASAEVGDDVYGEDPTVNRLESGAARMLGKAAALFFPSGTQSNFAAVLAHCQRGDEYIAGQQAHVYRYEGGGSAVLGGVQPQPLDFQPDGTLDLDEVERLVKPNDPHFARTRLLCLENTQLGKVLPLPFHAEAAGFARRHGLALHLDGARLFNAAVRDGVDAGRIAEGYDSVSICLNKGLGAPAGSLLCGETDLIGRARRWRKVVGGGMRQAGILAAAGLYALENNIVRLAEDHANAARLAAGLESLAGVELCGEPQTNMVFVRVCGRDPDLVAGELSERGVRVLPAPVMRLVTHLDVSGEDMDFVVEAFRELLA